MLLSRRCRAYLTHRQYRRFNLLGQVAITAGADFGLANLISTTAQVTNGYNPSPGRTLALVALILISHVAVNALSIRRLRYMIYTAIGLNSVFVAALAISVLAGAKSHNSARFVFANFFDGTAATPDDDGWSVRASRKLYLVLITRCELF